MSDVIYPFIDPFLGKSLSDKPLWEPLKEAIEKVVRRDGVKEDRLQVLPGYLELKEDFILNAVDTIYSDVAEFYGWYFNPDDDRTIWTGATQNKTLEGKLIPFNLDVDPALREKVTITVSDNLEAMRDTGEIPQGRDVDSLDDIITDDLVRYISNWSAWYYDRNELEAIDGYFEDLDFYESIYDDDGYGGLTNLLDDSQYDGVTDVPYIYET